MGRPIWTPGPAEGALDRLHEVIADALDTGQRVPCLGADDATRRFWTSEDRDELEAAAFRCLPCPVLAVCRTAGAAEKWGTWGGIPIGPRTKDRAA